MFNVKLISCRTSEKFYKNITKIVKKNGVSIIFLLNYILDEFIENINIKIKVGYKNIIYYINKVYFYFLLIHVII